MIGLTRLAHAAPLVAAPANVSISLRLSFMGEGLTFHSARQRSNPERCEWKPQMDTDGRRFCRAEI